MKNRYNSIATAVLAVTLATGITGAAQAYDTETELQPVRDDQVVSVGIGALIGALAGGPPGLIIGMMAMNAVDSHQLHEEQQHSAQMSDPEESVSTVTHGDQEQTETLAAFEASRPADRQIASLSGITAASDQTRLTQALATHFEQWVQFRSARAELEPHIQKQLIRAATWMSQMPAVHIELHGFADPRGTDQDNMTLSRARLDSVRRVLIAGGIDASRITGYAHGESLPLYNDDGVESNNFERRVLISFQIQAQQS